MYKLRNKGKRWLALVLASAVMVSTAFTGVGVPTVNAAEEKTPYVVSLNRPVFASSESSAASSAVDGDSATRWQAGNDDDNEWIYVDLGKETEITGVYVSWEAAAASNYVIQFSNDEVTWTDKVEVTDGVGPESRMLDITGIARYVRVLCKERYAPNATYGCSLYEFQVYGLDGLVARPIDYGTNIAMNKTVTASSIQQEWWMDTDGDGVYDQTNVLPENAVDGVKDTKAWHSSGANASKKVDDQWITVDLGAQYEIGRIAIEWSDSARAYQIQVSNDETNWTTIYSKLNVHPTSDNLPIYANARYVRIYCIASWAFNGFGIKELEVYPYRAGEEKVTYELEEIPEIQTISVEGSEATYATDDVRFPMAKPPLDLAEELQMPNQPVDSNDWWQTMMITDLGEGLVVLPLRVKHSTNGLGIVAVNDCWYGAEDQRMGALGTAYVNSKIDFYLSPEGMDTSKVYDTVIDYSDYAVTAQLCDATGPVMTNTYVKGSPYLYSEFGNNQDMVIYSTNITGIYDDNGNELLTEDNKTITLDHFGIEVTDDDNKEKTKTAKSYFSINLPANTTVKRVGDKIKLHFAEPNGYVSVGTMTKREDLTLFYQHGYAFVRDTAVTYYFDEDTSKVYTYYDVSTDVKRDGFSEETLQCLFPHQYKISDAEVSDELSYVTSRGTMKTLVGNGFETVDTFYGMVPTFTTPQNDEYDNAVLTSYLSQIEKNTHNIESLPGGDAYWQGKTLHPLALATLVADQTGNIEYRDMFLERLRYCFEDWFTYSGEEDEVYFYYDKNWGTLYYRYSEFGANTGICDHHFTYGYFLFAATVLATYDDAFYEEYKEMLDLIVRDYASPYEDDPLFCRFRSYDLYEGHSWAGGYADNSDGNNQEAGGESLFGWVGMYLWALRSGNTDFRDAAIFGFTTELNAIEQYWFNYDGDNWPEDWPHHIVGQNYGATIFYATFFDGNTTSVYGIHWLPVAEWITHYGMGDNEEDLKRMYEGFLEEIEAQRVIENEKEEPGPVKTSLTDWQHIFVPLRSQYDPDGALEDYWKVVNGEVTNDSGSVVTFDSNEQFNAYWFANSMKDLGVKTDEIYAIGGVSASVYKDREDGSYTAIAWNPTDSDITIQFTDGTSIVGTALIGAGSLVRFDPLNMNTVQVSTPEFSIDSDIYEDTQYLAITTATEGAVIHYTTDGSNPTMNSPVYDGRIPISSTTTVKAIAVKNGCIDSNMKAATITIDGSCITTGVNIAIGKTVTASSGQGTASNMVDADAKTRWETTQTDVGYSNDDWCTVDLGKEYTINKVKISWEAAFASQYKIQVSNDNATWQDVYVEETGNGGFDEAIFNPVSARYVRMQGVARGSAYGYSIYEIGIYEARQISKPEFSLATGSYDGNQFLSIASGTQGVEIRYTTDGTEPTEESELYIPRLTIWKDVTIKAKAFKLGMIPSETVEVTYQITNGTEPEDTDNYDENDTFKVTPDAEIDEEPLAGETVEVEDPYLKGSLSYKKEVTVSSSENANTAQNITDGNVDTGWSSAFAEDGVNFTDERRFDQWCYVDLGESVELNEVKIKWITSNNVYKIQVSNDAQNWNDVYTHTQPTTDDKIDICRFDKVKARYVKLQGVEVGQAWGYSLAEMMVYLSSEEQPLGANIALNALMTASTGADAVDNMKDGDAATTWAPSDTNNQIVTVDLYKTYQIDKVVLARIQEYTGKVSVYVSTTGTDGAWTKVIDNADASEDGIYKFDVQQARYVQIEFTGAIDTLSVGELEVYTTGSPDVADVNVTYYDRVGAGASSNADNAAKIMDDISDNANMWQAANTDTNAWCYVDLGEAKDVNIVSINWEASYAETYNIYLTNNIENWIPNVDELAYEGVSGKAGEVQTVLTNPGTARYVVMYQTKASDVAVTYGCAVYEMNAGYRDAVAVESVKASPSTTTLVIGQTVTADYVVSPSNADNTNVNWISSDTTVATVSNKGVIKAKAAGTAIITVTAESDDTKTATVTVNVTGPLKAPRPKAEVTEDNTITVSWTAVEHAAGYNVYRSKSQNSGYKLVNANVVTESRYVDSNVASGTYYYKIEVLAPENDAIYQNSELSTQSIGVTISVKNDVTQPTEESTTEEGDVNQPTEESTTEEGDVNQPTEESTTEEGDVNSPTEESTTEEGDVNLPTEDSTTEETPKDIEVTSVTLNQTSATLVVGGHITLTAVLLPAEATNKNILWSTSNPSVAKVVNGVVTAVAEGETIVTATAANGVKAICSIKVVKDIVAPGVETNKNVSKVDVAVESRPYGTKTVYLKKRAGVKLKSTVEGDDGINKEVTYSSSDSKIVTVNSKGKMKAKSKTGTAYITVTSVQDPTKTAVVKVKVVAKIASNKVLKLKKTKIQLKSKGESAQIQVKKYTKKATDAITYKVISGKKYVKVDKYGVIISKVNAGKKTVSAKIQVKYGKKKAVMTVTIPKK